MKCVIAENYVMVGNFRVRYLEGGSGELTLVIVPPSSMPIDKLMGIINALTGKFKVLVVDSSTLTRMNRLNKVTALSALLSRLNGNTNFVIIGLGQGGVVVLDYISQSVPESLMGVVLVSTPRIINYIDKLSMLNKPMLLICSANDPNAPFEEANTVKSVVKNAELLLINDDWVKELGGIIQSINSWILKLMPHP